METTRPLTIDLFNNVGSAPKYRFTRLQVAEILALLYSASHGIHASLAFASIGIMQIFQAAGVALVEIVLFILVRDWHSGRIVDGSQKTAAAIVGVTGATLAALAIVTDIRLLLGHDLSGFLDFYFYSILPLSPLVMAAGAVLVSSMSPALVQERDESLEETQFGRETFEAMMATKRAERLAELQALNVQLNAKLGTSAMIDEFYRSQDAQDAVKEQARKNLPYLLRQAGITYAPPEPQRQIMASAPTSGAMPSLIPATPPTDAAGSFQSDNA